jgi:D-sedoheptulose 7-phosphate isomerase
MLETYRERVAETLRGISLVDYDQVLSCLRKALEMGSELFFIGNGGSSATASHAVNDFVKLITDQTGKPVRAQCLSDNTALITALANDINYSDIYAAQIQKSHRWDTAVLIALSGSGNSPNVINAVTQAHKQGWMTIGLSGRGGGQLAEIVDLSLIVPSQSMQIIEDVHSIICHCLCLDLIERLNAS